MTKRQRQSNLSLLLLVVLTASEATFTACESSDLPIQHADNYDAISFSAQTERMSTRTNPYEAYSQAKHPSSMGVFGYHDISQYDALTATALNPIFDNTRADYDSNSLTWTYTGERKWDTYKGATSFDFFACMPQTAGAKLARTATDTYQLSMPFTIPSPSSGASSGTPPSPLFYDVRQAPIICATPEHKEGTNATGTQFTFERIINFRFDQTLTAYRLLFKLDNKMGALRYFRIRSVTLSGELATSGTVSRTYTWKDKEWTAGDIQWDIARTAFSTDNPFSIAYASSSTVPKDDKSETNPSNENHDDDTKTVKVTSEYYEQWGETFYTIPDAQFTPTIKVTYDVEFVDEDGNTVVTRKDVTSDIILNKTNFGTLATGGIAMVNAIRILIQPRYLYVLADGDAYSGHLLIE